MPQDSRALAEIQCALCHHPKTPVIISHRIATFKHEDTGIELQLLPGFIPKDQMQNGKLIFRDENGNFTTFNNGSEQIGHIESFNNRGLSTIILYTNDPLNIRMEAKVYNEHNEIKPFLIGRWPVTRRQWAVGRKSHKEIPKTGISFKETKVFMALNGLRLPCEKEWSHACSAGTTTRFYFGEEFDESHVWYAGNSDEHEGKCTGYEDAPGVSIESCGLCQERPHSPEEHDNAGKCNSFGLVDMLGNVMEWIDSAKGMGFSFGNSEEDMKLQGSNFVFNVTNLQWTGFRAALSIPGLT